MPKLFETSVEFMLGIKRAKIDEQRDRAQTAGNESILGHAQAIAHAEVAKAKAICRQLDLSDDETIMAMGRIIDPSNPSIAAQILDRLTRHDPRKFRHFCRYVATGTAPDGETAVFAPLFESSLSVGSFTRAQAESVCRAHNLARGKTKAVNFENQFQTYLILLADPKKGIEAIKAHKADGNKVTSWTWTPRGRMMIQSAIRARNIK